MTLTAMTWMKVSRTSTACPAGAVGSPPVDWKADHERPLPETMNGPVDAVGNDHDVATPLPKQGPVGWFGRPVFLEARSPFELMALRRHRLWSGEGVPRGHNRPVLIIPGFLASPTSADALMRILRLAGWNAMVADVGRNSGPAYTGVETSERNLRELFSAGGEPVTIVGHSRGGQFARILAVRHPNMVQRIITVGAPLLLKYPRFAPVRVPIEVLEITWRRGTFGPVNPEREQAVDRDRFVDFPEHIDFISIYSRTDGIVDWRASLDPAAQLVEISSSHLGLIKSVAGVQAVADALA